MWRRSNLCAAAFLILSTACQALPAGLSTNTVPDQDAVRQDFMAAMQRVRQRLPDAPDSPALEAYVIHDYLVAARLRRDVAVNPSEDLDVVIDAFLRAHAGQPVSHGLRREWLVSL